MNKLKPVYIEGKNIIIRNFNINDVEAYYKNLTTDIYENTGDSPPEKFDEIFAKKIIKMSLNKLKENKALILGIFSKENGNFIGSINTFDFDFNVRKAEIGYWIIQKERKKGYLTEALGFMCNYLFNVINLNRIYAEGVFTFNSDSCYVLERIGFKKEGLRKQNSLYKDEIVDDYIYGLIKEDWK